MTTVAENFCQTLQSPKKEFLWGGRKAKIKHSTLAGDYHLGGLRNVDIRSKIFSLKFRWINAFKDRENFHPWKLVASQLLPPVAEEYVSHANLKLSLRHKGKVKQLNSFYRDLVDAWETLGSGRDINPDCKEMILPHSLWNNSLLCFYTVVRKRNQTGLYKHPKNNGLESICWKGLEAPQASTKSDIVWF